MRSALKILLSQFLLFSMASAYDVSVSKVNLTTEVEVFIDNNQTLSLTEIQSDNGIPFGKIEKNSANFGFSDATFWLRIKLENLSTQNIRRYIVYKDPLIGYLDIWFKQDHHACGVLRPHLSPFINPTFPINLEPKEGHYLYVRASSDVTPMNIQLMLYDETTLNRIELINHVILGIFFGFLIALIIYNASVYISIKDKVYLYYILYVFGILVHHLGYKGFQQLYIAPATTNYVLLHPVAIMDAIMVSGMVLFAIAFLHIEKYPKIYRFLQFLLGVGIFNAVIMLYPPFYNLEIVFLWAFFVMGTLVISAVYLLRQGVHQARIYLLGWIPLIIMFSVLLLRQLFGINWLALFPYFEEFAIGFEAIVFSIALSLRIKRINAEKNEATQKFLKSQQEAKEKLEYEVAHRTKELQHRVEERSVLLREVNHRVKNNMQIIISMLRLQADRYGKEIKDIVSVAENRIRSMLSIHELLYKSDNLSRVDATVYIAKLIDEISKSFAFDNKKVQASIQGDDMPIDVLVQSGFIINELVTNAIKYAENPVEVEISVQLKEEGDSVHLEVKDNGVLQKNVHSEGLGMVLVRTIIEEQLRGKIEIFYDQGYHVLVHYPKNSESI